MDLGIKNKVALVTAASQGLGKASAIELANEGVKLAICSRDQDKINQTAEEIQNLTGGEVLAVKADLDSTDDIENLIKEIENKFNTVDILVNNTGGPKAGFFDDLSDEDWLKTFESTFLSAVRVTRKVLPFMKKNKWGRIINIASIYGREYGGSAPYMAAKAALIAATKHTAINLAKTGVTANCIAPGSIKHEKGSWEKFVNNNNEATVNNFIEKNLPMGDFGYPEAVGDTVSFLASENSKMILGTCLNVDGGQSNSLF